MIAPNYSKALLILCGIWWLAAAPGLCAETADPSATATTVMTLTLDAARPVEFRTRFQDQPPTITIEFPKQRVVGSLPERSTIQEGVIQTLLTQYYSGDEFQPSRFIRSLQIILSASYAYRVRSEPGRIVVAIDHPASVGSKRMEVGLTGGTVIRGVGERPVAERFRAMQHALDSAVPGRTTPETPSAVQGSLSLIRSRVSGEAKSSETLTVVRPQIGAVGSWASRPKPTQAPWLAIAGFLAAVAAALWLRRHPDVVSAALRRAPAQSISHRLPSGVALIDELIWQAFERQGYQLIQTVERTQPSGLLRVITKEGAKSALLFVWNGSFFEKRTVDQFAAAMREVGVAQGVLVASGSFTVPAQRVAKERGIALIGREQLMELLSAGATSEYFTKQVEQLHARLEESRVTLQEYANQLDTLRRQRNEASWYLGEERAKTSQIEDQLADAGQQLRQREAELAQWAEETDKFRKQWEESQWYFGESRERIRHLETTVSELQETTQRFVAAERERDEANWYLGEARQRVQTFEQQLASAQEQLAASVEREQTLQSILEDLKRTLRALQAYGERRRMARAHLADAHIALLDGDDEQPLFMGAPRDLSSSGIGLETDRQLPEEELRVRLSLPGESEPIHSKARIMWQQQAGDGTPRFHSGCRLLELPDTVRSRIAQYIEQAKTT
ncbi:MAG: PilZ domain-containing protein [Candidatus Omnitrophota bacterium]|nr:PilZ domain-containing protein [Candidatus Omnitrophota bacterium]